ncbi:hypothetical protein [Moraxella lacunata]|uniref:hypothetical protein n=1 Tax=Moraxella lacunata TaxID=477 RepID=UPI003EE193DF
MLIWLVVGISNNVFISYLYRYQCISKIFNLASSIIIFVGVKYICPVSNIHSWANIIRPYTSN